MSMMKYQPLNLDGTPRPPEPTWPVSCVVSSDAFIHETARINEGVVIKAGAVVKDRAVVLNHAELGMCAHIERGATVLAGARVTYSVGACAEVAGQVHCPVPARAEVSDIRAKLSHPNHLLVMSTFGLSNAFITAYRISESDSYAGVDMRINAGCHHLTLDEMENNLDLIMDHGFPDDYPCPLSVRAMSSVDEYGHMVAMLRCRLNLWQHDEVNGIQR